MMGGCYYDENEFGAEWITGRDGVPRWVCQWHADLAKEDNGTVEYLHQNRVHEVNGRWKCVLCGREWSPMMSEDRVPNRCDCVVRSRR